MLGLFLLLACAPEPDPCEEAFLRQEEAVRLCGVEVTMARWTGDVCSEEEALLLSCEANCMEVAECIAIADGRRAEAGGSLGSWDNYAFCIGNCPTPW